MAVEKRQLHKEAFAKDTITTLRGGIELETKLARIAQIAKERPKEQFTSLVHLLNEDMLIKCHKELNGNKRQE